MAKIEIPPNVLQIIEGVRPYLAADMQTIADAILEVAKAINSPAVQETIGVVSQVYSTQLKPALAGLTNVEDNSAPATDSFDLKAIAFNPTVILFLILILLFLSS